MLGAGGVLGKDKVFVKKCEPGEWIQWGREKVCTSVYERTESKSVKLTPTLQALPASMRLRGPGTPGVRTRSQGKHLWQEPEGPGGGVAPFALSHLLSDPSSIFCPGPGDTHRLRAAI